MERKKNAEEIVLERLVKQQSESDNRIEFEAWLVAMEELKRMNKIPDGRPIWGLCLTILETALPSQFSAVHALQLLKFMFSMKVGF